MGVLGLLIAFEIIGMRKGTLIKPFKRVDYSAHLGGYASGIVAGGLIWRSRNQRRMERVRQEEKTRLQLGVDGKVSA